PTSCTAASKRPLDNRQWATDRKSDPRYYRVAGIDRDRLAVLHQRWLDDDGTMRERDDAAAMRVADPAWQTPPVPRW
ncbi:hypothetical protein ACWCRC_38460, partial [Streptomyces sp. NPDC001940]